MTTLKKKRASALVPWSHNGNAGVLVHADSAKNEWVLPGGGLEPAVNGQIETPRVAVIRELRERPVLSPELSLHCSAMTGNTASIMFSTFVQAVRYRSWIGRKRPPLACAARILWWTRSRVRPAT